MIAPHFRDMHRFVILQKEETGRAGRERSGQLIRSTSRSRLETAPVYDSFDFDSDNKVVRFVPEEN
jgi:hypothetical protein